MSYSDDDEEFISADEDNLDESDDERSKKNIKIKCDPKDTTIHSDVIDHIEQKNKTKHTEARSSHLKGPNTISDSSTRAKISLDGLEDISAEHADTSNVDDDENGSERDREKNLKLARKFSAEILKASSPHPVKGTPPIQIIKPTVRNRDTCEDSKLGLPPAPPPTPALSSSYSNSDDPPPSQFSWRVVPKSKQCQPKTTIINESQPSEAMPSKVSNPQPSSQSQKVEKPRNLVTTNSSKHEESSRTSPVTAFEDSLRLGETKDNKQDSIDMAKDNDVDDERPIKLMDTQPKARFALDRLSESVSQSRTQNIFEKVVDDIKRVSLKTDQGEILAPPSMASITELGSTLGGWGWSGASKLIASASQVTSQVGSVLDTVVNVAQQTIQEPDRVTTTEAVRPAGRKDKDD